MLHASRIEERAGNHAGIVDVDRAGPARAGKIDLREQTTLEKPAVLPARRVKKETDDISLGIDVVRLSRDTARRVEWRKGKSGLRRGKGAAECQGNGNNGKRNSACFHGLLSLQMPIVGALKHGQSKSTVNKKNLNARMEKTAK